MFDFNQSLSMFLSTFSVRKKNSGYSLTISHLRQMVLNDEPFEQNFMFSNSSLSQFEKSKFFSCTARVALRFFFFFLCLKQKILARKISCTVQLVDSILNMFNDFNFIFNPKRFLIYRIHHFRNIFNFFKKKKKIRIMKRRHCKVKDILGLFLLY